MWWAFCIPIHGQKSYTLFIRIVGQFISIITMKKWLVCSVLILVLIFLGGTWAFRYWGTGIIIPLGSASCGANFENGFKQAVTNNNPSFCLNTDLQSINQYKNLEGNEYCSIPITGLMTTEAGIARGNADECLSAMAAATQNVKACDLMKDSAPKDSCYSALAKNTHNSSYCSQILNTDERNLCLNPEWYPNSPNP